MSQAQLVATPSFSPSIIMHNGRPATTSLELAKFFGKRHDHVLRSVNILLDSCPKKFTAPNFGASEYTDETGRALPMFILHRDGFMLLVMGYTGKKALQIKLAYIEAFNAMESKIAAGDLALPAAPTKRQPLPEWHGLTPEAIDAKMIPAHSIGYLVLREMFNCLFRATETTVGQAPVPRSILARALAHEVLSYDTMRSSENLICLTKDLAFEAIHKDCCRR